MRNSKGQSIMELVVGVGLITIIMGAMTVVAINTLRNTQFSKNQTQATKLAQDNLEKVRTIKNSNFGVCLQNEPTTSCSRWEDIWNINLGTTASGCVAGSPGCGYILTGSCTVNTGVVKPFCLKYSAVKGAVETNSKFSYQILIEDEAAGQKRVTSRVFWTDTASTNSTSPEHSSDLVTVLTRN